MQRYFVKNDCINNTSIKIEGKDFHHIKNVMRMKEGTHVFVVDEDETVYLCEIDKFFDKYLTLNIIKTIEKKVELDVLVTIALGLTKRDKLEEVLRRITELGASGFINVEMERSIVKVKEVKENKFERLNMIVKEASEQSHRNRLLKVYPLVNIKEFINFSKNYDLKLFAYEEEGKNSNYQLKSLLTNFKGKTIIILSGPEGGFTDKEVKLLQENHFLAIGLGPRILRCETAPLYIMSVISYELEFKE